MNLTDRLITAIVEKCDGLSITAEQASNILAYLQYGAPLVRAAIAAGGAQEPVAWEMDWPEYSYDGMGCGLEDRNITDRYDAMKYGWDEALERVGQILERDGPLYAAPLPCEAATVALTDERGEQVRLMQWQGGAGLLWDVYAFGKWQHRIVSPVDWDAHTVYLDMQRAGYAEHIELRLVSSSNNASPDEPQAAAPAAAGASEGQTEDAR